MSTVPNRSRKLQGKRDREPVTDIRSDIPIPEGAEAGSKRRADTLIGRMREMEVGESFEWWNQPNNNTMAVLRPKRFTIRKELFQDIWRIWRIE